MKRLFLALLACAVLTSCTDTEWAQIKAYGDTHVILLYAADGHVIEQWESTGKVICSEGGICSFMDATTGKLVRTTGDIVVKIKIK